MNIGRKRHPVEVQQYTPGGQDPMTGEMTDPTWTTTGIEWAAIKGIWGREFLASNAEQAATTIEVIIRYRADLTTSNRFVYQGRKFDIKALLPNNTMTELVCMCETGLVN